MRGRLDHAPGVARGAYRAAFARKRDQKIVAALRAPRAGKTVGEDAAFQIAAELSFHVLRHTVPAGVPVAGERQVGLEVPLDRPSSKRIAPIGSVLYLVVQLIDASDGL